LVQTYAYHLRLLFGDSSPIDRLCDPWVTSAARRGNLALAMNTDDYVIWFTYGEDVIFTVGEDHITPYR
jgi:hypothetical protein